MIDIALDLAARGIPVFPCRSDNKRPMTEHGHLEASTDAAHIRRWFADSGALIGVPTGSRSGFDALDLDPRHGSDAWLAEHGGLLPITRVHTTRSGGQHWLFTHAEGVRNSQSKIAPGLDVRGEGGFIIWWPDVWLDEPIAPWPPALLAAATRRPPARARPIIADQTPLQTGVAEIESAQPGERYEVCKTVIWHLAMLVKGGLLDEAEARDATTTAAEAAGGEDMEKVARLWDSALDKVTPITGGAEFPVVEPRGLENWRSMLQMQKDAVRGNDLNAVVAMKHSPDWSGVLGFDLFAQQTKLQKTPPWGGSYLGEVRDVDITRAAVWLQTEGIQVSVEVAHRAIVSVSVDRGFDPLRAYYEGLKWDGVARAEALFVDHFGAEDTPLNRAFAKRFLISMVARGMEPGCKVDAVPIFEGPQNIGKSSAARALVDDGWFTDHIPDLTSKDAPAQLLGVHLVEFAEMDKLSRADMNVVKAFITTQVDRYRPPYGKVAANFPRRCVFVGTVNPSGNGYLRDETGNRRFWPIACGVGWPLGRSIDIPALKAARPQIMAEAVALYRAGQKWWLDTADLESLQAEAAGTRFEQDAWAERIRLFLSTRNETSTNEILTECLRKPADRWTVADQQRVGKVMKVEGWLRRLVRVGTEREYRYMREQPKVVRLDPTLKQMLS